MRRLLWSLSAVFGAAGTFVLYLSFASQSLTLGVYAVVLIGSAATIVYFLPD